jgi:hypothetical protein
MPAVRTHYHEGGLIALLEKYGATALTSRGERQA